jgi:hypothetical protein
MPKIYRYCAGCSSEFLVDENDSRRHCEPCSDAQRQRPAYPAQPSDAEAQIPLYRLKQLIALTHPDRHGNSKASNEVTQWLLKLRDQQEKAKCQPTPQR